MLRANARRERGAFIFFRAPSPRRFAAILPQRERGRKEKRERGKRECGAGITPAKIIYPRSKILTDNACASIHEGRF